MSLDLVCVLLFPFEKSDEAIWKMGGLERGNFAQKCDGGTRSETLGTYTTLFLILLRPARRKDLRSRD